MNMCSQKSRPQDRGVLCCGAEASFLDLRQVIPVLPEFPLPQSVCVEAPPGSGPCQLCCSSPCSLLTGWCLQVLELICTRESGAVFEAGGLNCVLSFIRDSGHLVHKDTLHSAMAVVSRLCSKMEPQDSSLETCVESLSSLLKHEDHQVSSSGLVSSCLSVERLRVGGAAAVDVFIDQT